MSSREEIVSLAAVRLNMETQANRKYAMAFCQSLADALKRIEDTSDRTAAEEAMAEFELKGGVPLGQIEAEIAIETAMLFADQFRSGAQGANMDCDAAQILAAAIDYLIAHQAPKTKGLTIADWVNETLNEAVTRGKASINEIREKAGLSPLAQDILEIVEGIEKYRKNLRSYINPAPDASAPRVADETVDTTVSAGRRPTNVIKHYKDLLAIEGGLVAPDPQWQKLRDILGLDGWNDGLFQGIPNEDQIVTHVHHINSDRLRLLRDNTEMKIEKSKTAKTPAFTTSIAVDEDLGITTIVFEDCPYIAVPIIPDVHHWMDKHLAMTEDRRIVGATIWQASPKPKDRVKIFQCPECKGKGGEMDTTYDRTGAWEPCGLCGGSGQRAIVEKMKPVGKDD